MRRRAPDHGRRRARRRGQATVEWVGLVVAVALLAAAVGAAVRSDVPRQVLTALLDALRPQEPVERDRTASEATLAFAREAVASRQGGPSLLGARALLRTELGTAGGAQRLDELLLAHLAARRPAWFEVQVVGLATTSMRGVPVGGGVRTTVPVGPVVVHLVTPAEEAAVAAGGRGEALRTWLGRVVQDDVLTRLGARADATLDRGDAGRLPRLVVGVAPTAVGALPVLLAEAEEGWPTVGETAGDAILCRPVSVRVVQAPGSGGRVRAGVRVAVVRAGDVVVDAVSTVESRCDRLRP